MRTLVYSCIERNPWTHRCLEGNNFEILYIETRNFSEYFSINKYIWN